MKKNLFIKNLSMLLLLLPALSFAQGTVSGATSCYPYAAGASSPNTYNYTISYTPPSGYTLDAISWYFSQSNYEAAIYDANGKATTMKVGWKDNNCLIDGSAEAYATYTKAGEPNINITTARLIVKILCLKTPTSMTGTFSVPCNNNTAITYCIPPVTNATSYEWTYPAGWQPSGAIDGYCITLIPTLLTPGTSSAQICVRAKNTAQGLVSGWYCKTINPRAPTTAPGFINPTLNVCIPSGHVIGYNISSVSGATSYSWSMTNGSFSRPVPTGTSAAAEFSSAGIATVSARGVNACGTGPTGSISVNVSSSGPAVPQFISAPQDVCQYNNTTVQIAPVSGANGYAWRYTGTSGGIKLTGGGTSVNVGGIKLGSYNIYVKAINSCGSSAEAMHSIYVNDCGSARISGIANSAAEKEVFLFPNPANTSFEVSIPGNESSVRIKMTNMAGQVIRDISTNESKSVIQSADIPAGLYIINISSDDINTVNKIQIVK